MHSRRIFNTFASVAVVAATVRPTGAPAETTDGLIVMPSYDFARPDEAGLGLGVGRNEFGALSIASVTVSRTLRERRRQTIELEAGGSGWGLLGIYLAAGATREDERGGKRLTAGLQALGPFVWYWRRDTLDQHWESGAMIKIPIPFVTWEPAR